MLKYINTEVPTRYFNQNNPSLLCFAVVFFSFNSNNISGQLSSILIGLNLNVVFAVNKIYMCAGLVILSEIQKNTSFNWDLIIIGVCYIVGMVIINGLHKK